MGPDADSSDGIRQKLDLAGNPGTWTIDRVISSKVLGDVRSFTSGVTNRTNPVPVAKSSYSGRSSGGGGHSCACACACAGCACACAGGGR